MNRHQLWLNIRDIAIIALGCTLTALAYVLFLIPHHIVPGGVSGLAMILHFLLKTPVGLVAIAINIPIFIWGVREIGRIFAVKSVIGMVLSSLLIDFFSYVVRLGSVTENRILATVYGGILLGTGLGIVFRGNGSTGGSDILGQILSHHSNLSTGVAIMVIDFIVISLAGITAYSVEIALYGYAALFLSGRVIDMVIEGWSYAKALLIISDSPDEITATITGKFRRGATRLAGKGGYTGASRDVIYCVATRREIPMLKRAIKEIDPKAFVVITDVYEVLGEGFKPRT